MFKLKDSPWEHLLLHVFFSEIYLQHLEITQIVNILLQHHTVGHFRYVDDILIVYKQDLTNIQNVLTKFNSLTPNLNFTIEEEKNNSINFLEITITKNDNHLSYKAYRRPTTTDSTIPNHSCHPSQHKLSAIRFFTNRRATYHLDNESKQIENNIIDQILHNNKYDSQSNRKTPKPKTSPEDPTPIKMVSIHLLW
jgi:hypothetical protein